MINLLEVLIDEIRIAALESTWSPDEKKYFEAFFERLSSSCGKAVPLDQTPRHLKSKIIADGEKAITTSTSRENTKNWKEEAKDRRQGSSVRDRVPKFRLPRTYQERKANPPSVKGSVAREKNTSERSNSRGEEKSDRVDEENCNDSGDEEVVRSMRKMKMQGFQSSEKNARPQKTPSPDPFMMAMLDKYRD